MALLMAALPLYADLRRAALFRRFIDYTAWLRAHPIDHAAASFRMSNATKPVPTAKMKIRSLEREVAHSRSPLSPVINMRPSVCASVGNAMHKA